MNNNTEEGYALKKLTWTQPTKLFKGNHYIVQPSWFTKDFSIINLSHQFEKGNVIELSELSKDAVENKLSNPWDVIEYTVEHSFDIENWNFKIKNEKTEEDPWGRLKIFRARLKATEKNQTVKHKCTFSVQVDLTNGRISFRMWSLKEEQHKKK